MADIVRDQPTDRGFTTYLMMRDTYDRTVIVRESSLATQRCAWIYADDGAVHLSEDMAREVRDALNRFLGDAEGGEQ